MFKPALGEKLMLNRLGFSFALLSLLLGSFLLYDAAPRSDPTQRSMVIGGAFFLALGLVTISLVTRDWWEWRRHNKNAARSVSD